MERRKAGRAAGHKERAEIKCGSRISARLSLSLYPAWLSRAPKTSTKLLGPSDAQGFTASLGNGPSNSHYFEGAEPTLPSRRAWTTVNRSA